MARRATDLSCLKEIRDGNESQCTDNEIRTAQRLVKNEQRGDQGRDRNNRKQQAADNKDERRLSRACACSTLGLFPEPEHSILDRRANNTRAAHCKRVARHYACLLLGGR